jgi:uncharacterized protein YkwD
MLMLTLLTSSTHHPHRRLTGLLATLALVASTVTGLVAASPAQAAAPSTQSAERSFVASINSARHASGRSHLATSSSLTSVARTWARSLARSGRLAHNSRVTSQVRSWHYLGENVGVGGSTSSLHRAFMGSPSHRANVLSTRYTRVGVGVAYGHGRMWVVEVFERPAAAATRSAHRTARTIGYGSRGTTVKKVQRKLRVRPTGYFGKVTLSKVRAYQKRHHLHVTGRLDAPTRRKLHV